MASPFPSELGVRGTMRLLNRKEELAQGKHTLIGKKKTAAPFKESRDPASAFNGLSTGILARRRGILGVEFLRDDSTGNHRKRVRGAGSVVQPRRIGC